MRRCGATIGEVGEILVKTSEMSEESSGNPMRYGPAPAKSIVNQRESCLKAFAAYAAVECLHILESDKHDAVPYTSHSLFIFRASQPEPS